MVSQLYFTFFVLAIAGERLVELWVANRNRRWSLQQGGQEFASKHYPFMVVLHAALLIGCLAEVWLFDRPFYPVWGTLMVALVLIAQGLRWWVIGVLGRMWNTRIIVVPGLKLVTQGPFKYLSHPNYLAVAIEGFALPMVHSAWMTAVAFTVGNLIIMKIRIPEEEKALRFLNS